MLHEKQKKLESEIISNETSHFLQGLGVFSKDKICKRIDRMVHLIRSCRLIICSSASLFACLVGVEKEESRGLEWVEGPSKGLVEFMCWRIRYPGEIGRVSSRP